MRCPFCKEDRDRVVDSRASEGGMAVRRRRECLACRRRFTSYERVEESPLKVVKKSNKRAAFDINKVRTGVELACRNLAVPAGEIEALVHRVEAAVYQHHDREVSSRVVGDLVMEELRKLHPIAYIRFASVYLAVKDVEAFRRLVSNFLKGGGKAAGRRGAEKGQRGGAHRKD